MLAELVRPKSVVDVGCGTGEWLAQFKSNGISRICGVDGDYVDHEQLAITKEEFFARDLTTFTSIPGSFDLALSLEVGEHLPEPVADHFVRTLCSLAPVVAFSAAVPGQGGVQHVNEQWPSYWARKFKMNNYVVVDAIRYRVWDDDRIAWYYRQNLLMYVNANVLPRYPALERDRAATRETLLSLVHPGMYRGLLYATAPENQSLRVAGMAFGRALACAFKRHFGRNR